RDVASVQHSLSVASGCCSSYSLFIFRKASRAARTSSLIWSSVNSIVLLFGVFLHRSQSKRSKQKSVCAVLIRARSLQLTKTHPNRTSRARVQDESSAILVGPCYCLGQGVRSDDSSSGTVSTG